MLAAHSPHHGACAASSSGCAANVLKQGSFPQCNPRRSARCHPLPHEHDVLAPMSRVHRSSSGGRLRMGCVQVCTLSGLNQLSPLSSRASLVCALQAKVASAERRAVELLTAGALTAAPTAAEVPMRDGTTGAEPAGEQQRSPSWW